MIPRITALLVALMCSNCTVCVRNRAFPKFTWAWTQDARWEREAREAAGNDSAVTF